MDPIKYGNILEYVENHAYPWCFSKQEKLVLCKFAITKYVEGIPIADESAINVTKGLYSTFCRYGSPAHVISDLERKFVDQVLFINIILICNERFVTVRLVMVMFHITAG